MNPPRPFESVVNELANGLQSGQAVLRAKLTLESEVHVYSSGICCCSVCVPAHTSREEIERIVNVVNPTGIESRWQISDDTHFREGESNPHRCERDDDRLHYLLNC